MKQKTRLHLGVVLAASGLALLVQGTVTLYGMAGKATRYHEKLQPHLMTAFGVVTASSGEELERKSAVTLPWETVRELSVSSPGGSNRNVALGFTVVGVLMLATGYRMQGGAEAGSAGGRHPPCRDGAAIPP